LAIAVQMVAVVAIGAAGCGSARSGDPARPSASSTNPPSSNSTPSRSPSPASTPLGNPATQVKLVINRYVVAVDAHDLGTLRDLLAPSVEVVQPDGTSCEDVRGLTNVLAGYQASFDLTKGRLVISRLRGARIVLRSGNASARLTYRYGTSRPEPISFTLRGDGSRWAISRVIADCGAALPAPAPAPERGLKPRSGPTGGAVVVHPVGGCTVDLAPTQPHSITVYPAQPGAPIRHVHLKATSPSTAALKALCRSHNR
jgi:hypothetical protein